MRVGEGFLEVKKDKCRVTSGAKCVKQMDKDGRMKTMPALCKPRCYLSFLAAVLSRS